MLSCDVDAERFGQIMPPQNYYEGHLTEFKGFLAFVVTGQAEDDQEQCFIWVMTNEGVWCGRVLG